MRLHRLLFLSALFALPAQAQDETPKLLPSLDAALPADVRLLLASVPEVHSLFPINGSEPFAGTILKADVISFSANSELVLGAISAPFIIIAARDVKFPDTKSSYRIRFAETAAAKGIDGAAGNPGTVGSSLALPHVYLIADHFSVGNHAKPRMINLALTFPGVAGGHGGSGGAGRNGNAGANGRNAKSKPWGCIYGGGDGGPGEDGGVGGIGGNGGAGGNGSSVTFVSTRRGIGQFGYASIQNQGGEGGGGGIAGPPGQPGEGGHGGHGGGFCHSGDTGSSGKSGAAVSAGSDGANGTKGTVELIGVPAKAITG